jgi:hypothetical protein
VRPVAALAGVVDDGLRHNLLAVVSALQMTNPRLGRPAYFLQSGEAVTMKR